MRTSSYKVALIGNPNSGKSSLFNELTGLNQKISNYPGVTVDKKVGTFSLSTGEKIELIDYPGIYSMYPNSSDEKIVVEVLTNPQHEDYPDAIIYVAASQELERHFLLASQLRELNIPMLFCLTMTDLNEYKGVSYKINLLEDYLGVTAVEVSSLKGINIDGLKYQLIGLLQAKENLSDQPGYDLSTLESKAANVISEFKDGNSQYQNLLVAHHHSWLLHVQPDAKSTISERLDALGFESTKLQIEETLRRYNSFTPVIEKATVRSKKNRRSLTEQVDSVITHRFIGPLIFFAIMFFIFQAIYAWSEWPMALIENLFASLGSWIGTTLPSGWMTSLLTDGVIAGLGGIMVFIPQIAILFLLITALEEIGYMSRAVFMFDTIMQKVGLNGRSIVALISSGACAIPAIMSTRTIANWKERLITILVTPLISCSARIPVYTILIGFVVPSKTVWGGLNIQGLAFMGLYVLSIVAALLSAFIFKLILKSEERSFLMIELPQYKQPQIRNVLMTVKEKVWTFIIEAGKVILIISVILWFLASYGPPGQMKLAEDTARIEARASNLDKAMTDNLITSYRLESSYAGHLGKIIEPAIKPLGYDWKIGIALITSFAAREVFVGTMATIYSVGNQANEATLREKMAAEKNPFTGGPRYDLATSLSLLLFYVFAMQCMSTLAITKRETKSWKWPMVQLGFMSVLAYLSSLLAYQLLI